MEYLSDRVSVERSNASISVVISARPSRSKETVLVIWTLAWLLCGAYIIHARSELAAGDPLRQYLLAFLAFWAYFLLKIGRATLWRLKGFELWRIKEGTLTVKDSLFGYGRATDYFVDNIRKLGMIDIDPRSWKGQWNDSVWVIGGERLGFEHLGRKVVFGKGLTEEEARQLIVILKDALHRKRTG